jgi:hypothetical protein
MDFLTGCDAPLTPTALMGNIEKEKGFDAEVTETQQPGERNRTVQGLPLLRAAPPVPTKRRTLWLCVAGCSLILA